MNALTAERLVQIGMRAVIRDVQEYLNFWSWSTEGRSLADADALRAYLLAMLITSGAYDDADDPFGALRHQMIDHHE